MSEQSLYERLGGYDAIAAVTENFLPRLQSDDKLQRFWANRGADGIEREKQLLIDFLSNAAGGPVYYAGRDMQLSHVGMGVDEDDWQRLVKHLTATLELFDVPRREMDEVIAFVNSTKEEIVE